MENLKGQIHTAVNVFKSGDLKKAEKLCHNLISTNPKVVFLYNLMGLIMNGQKKVTEAIKYYEKGIKVDPNFGIIYNNLGLIYYHHNISGGLEKAEKLYKKSIDVDKKIPEPHNNLGILYNSLNKHSEAIICYKNALKINPKFFYTHNNLGSIYLTLGNFEEAKVHFEESLKINPKYLNPHRALSRITKYTKDNKHFLELIKIYKEIDSSNKENKMHIAYALGKAYEDTKNYIKAYELFSKANDIAKENINFSIINEEKKFSNIKKNFPRNIFSKYTDLGYKNKTPIFIIGMPRSGTTLLEQILSSHPDVFGADEIEFFPNLIENNFRNHDLSIFFNEVINFDKNVFKNIGKDYVEKIKKYSNNSKRVTDKLPENFLNVGLIKLVLPEAKIVNCYRNSKDNCLSIFKNYFSSGKIKFAYNLTDIIEYYNLYSDLMLHWEKVLPNYIINIKYEDLVMNTEKEIRNLLDKCGLSWNSNCLNFYKNKRAIKTASDFQARNKIFNSSLNSWKNYENNLQSYFKKLKF